MNLIQKLRKLLLLLLYWAIPIFLYISICCQNLMDSIGGIIMFFTLAMIPILINKNIKANAAHASILLSCAFAYILLAQLSGLQGNDLNTILKSLVDVTIENQNQHFGELQEILFSCVTWAVVMYPFFLFFYWATFNIIKHNRSSRDAKRNSRP